MLRIDSLSAHVLLAHSAYVRLCLLVCLNATFIGSHGCVFVYGRSLAHSHLVQPHQNLQKVAEKGKFLYYGKKKLAGLV